MQVPETRRDPNARFRRILLTVGVTICLYLGLESFLPPRSQPSAYAVVGAIRVYQTVGSPLVGKFANCKFQPTCSHYGLASVQKYGTLHGSARIVGRLWRCSPWGPPPGQDIP